MTYLQWLEDRIFAENGIQEYGGPKEDEENTFVNDRAAVRMLQLREYDVWYNGSDSELLNFYTKNETIDYAYEPWFWRNKDCYFWSVASTENDIKRTHQGLARDMIDTMVNILGFPSMSVGMDDKGKAQNELDAILDSFDFWSLYHDRQTPLTLVEGWGAWKIGWDLSLSDRPFARYYDASHVDFAIRDCFVVGIIYKNWYVDRNDQRYLITETHQRHGKDLEIITDCFKTVPGDEATLERIDPKECPFMEGIIPEVTITNYPGLMGTPSIFFSDPSGRNYGRSVYTDKVSEFDDLDQNRSQDANAVRASSVQKTMDTNYLERDPVTHLPKQPKVFDLKFISVKGPKDADGTPQSGNEPIKVYQPQLNLAQYSPDAVQIVMDIIQGYMSPATLGIDVAKKDNADAQREKEKVTIFTRNGIIRQESRVLSKVASELLCANEYLKSDKHLITVPEYKVQVKFPKFADESFENKLKTLGDAYANDCLSTHEYVEDLYGEDMSDDRKKSLEAYLDARHQPEGKGGGDGSNPFNDMEENQADAVSSEQAAKDMTAKEQADGQ